MKRITSFVLGLSLVAFLSFAATGITSGNLNLSQNTTEELPNTAIYNMIGTGDPAWADFAEGVGCGIGFVASVVSFPLIATGVGAIGWAVLASSTAAACAGALN